MATKTQTYIEKAVKRLVIGDKVLSASGNMLTVSLVIQKKIVQLFYLTVIWKSTLTHIFESRFQISKMKLQEVIDGLNRTIAGKEELLSVISNDTIRQFIQINVDELKRILEDLQKVKKSQNSS